MGRLWLIKTHSGLPHSSKSPYTLMLQQPTVSTGSPWQLLWSGSVPGGGPNVNTATGRGADIELGVLLGAGSFARVYQGRWSGLDVAVKVIHHDLWSAKDVANQVQLMLNLNHPNIVRAFHFTTKQLLPYKGSTAHVQPEAGSAVNPAVLAPQRTGSGSSGWPICPGLYAPRTDSTSAASTQQQQQQLQLADFASFPNQSAPDSFVPYAAAYSSVASTSYAASGDRYPAAAAAAAALRRGSAAESATGSAASATTLTPATPRPIGETVMQGSAFGSTLLPTGTGGSMQYTLFSSSGLSSLAHDLDGPAAAAVLGDQRGSAAASSSASRLQQVVLDPGVLPAQLSCSSLRLEEGSAGAQPGGTHGGGGGSSGTGRGVESSSPGRGQPRRLSGYMCETWLVTELCDRGTLAQQASDLRPQHSEQDMLCLLHLLRDVARALKLLKAQNVVHADLNAHNVLVASSPVARHGMVAKVADLGLSRVLKQHATHRTTGTVGMLTHQPPELLQEGRMSPAVDIYSFGIMMFEVFTRKAGYGRLRYGQIYHQVVVLAARPAVPPDMPEDYELIMKRCWSSEAAHRPSVDMLLDCLDLMIEDRQQLHS